METHFEWRKEFSVNVKILDEQHQKLFKAVDDLYQCILEGEVKEKMAGIFKALNEYSVVHFSAEEKYFKEFNYAEGSSHTILHEGFKKDLFAMEGKAVDVAGAFALLNFMENWWVNHILDIDKRYTKIFNEHGLS